jgi:hypothetical protein
MKKIIIAGGRDFTDYELLKYVCDNTITLPIEQIEIVSGTATGSDSLGEKWANGKGYKVVRFPANWDKYGKRAGYLRNVEMAEYSDFLIAFWNGKSKGTEHMINIAKSKGLPTKIVKYS